MITFLEELNHLLEVKSEADCVLCLFRPGDWSWFLKREGAALQWMLAGCI